MPGTEKQLASIAVLIAAAVAVFLFTRSNDGTSADSALAGEQPPTPSRDPVTTLTEVRERTQRTTAGNTEAARDTDGSSAVPDDSVLELAPILPPTISGVVIHQGELIEEAVVELVDVSADDDVARVALEALGNTDVPFTDNRIAVTDVDGHFDLGAAPPWTPAHRPALAVRAAGFVSLQESIDGLVARNGEIEMPRGEELTGTLLDPRGVPITDVLVAVDQRLSARGRGYSSISMAALHWQLSGRGWVPSALVAARTDHSGRFTVGGLDPGDPPLAFPVDPLHMATSWIERADEEGGLIVGTRDRDPMVLIHVQSRPDGSAPHLQVRSVELIGTDEDGEAVRRRVTRSDPQGGFESRLGWLDLPIDSGRLEYDLRRERLRPTGLSVEYSVDGTPWMEATVALADRIGLDAGGRFQALEFAPLPCPAPDEDLVTVEISLGAGPDGGPFDGVPSMRAYHADGAVELAARRVGVGIWVVDLRRGPTQLEVFIGGAPEAWPAARTQVAPGLDPEPVRLMLNVPTKLIVERPEQVRGSWTCELLRSDEGAPPEALRRATTTSRSVVFPALPVGPYRIRWLERGRLTGELEVVLGVAPTVATVPIIREPAFAPRATD
ncbi:hypothetical protein [Engelhardtia mirabilis]|uniref:Uncharacterized protein n=1 Tax=Engelhardtia mirabilis TaxID=2528011 RepID=A0A518BFN1_9BACT|nr:hypothetical protein Pla133_07890 [Planctomycetes bacterium Pla133]QDV00049.1 hypothetical protein Pla86_07880 [Planctomycetes bacterium Pla86]